jgi:DNA-binding NtrC family response regulator
MLSGPRRSILVVEDDAELRRTLEDLLMDAGLMVFSAVSVDAALGMLYQGVRPVLVISDVIMPGESVERLVAALAANERTRGVPVALMTGGPLTELPSTRYVLKKPFDLDDLLAVVDDALAEAEVRHRDSLAG